MARPRKTALDYIPFDIDFFANDAMVCIAGEFGTKGELAAVKLLLAVYRNGYFLEWNETAKYKVLSTLRGVSAELLDQIITRLVRWGFFDASLFDSVRVLTSVDIQRRYFHITKRWARSGQLPYLLVSPAQTRVSVTKTPVNDAETPSKERYITEQPQCGGIEGDTPAQPESPTFEQVKEQFLTLRADERLDDWEYHAEQCYSHYSAVGWRTAAGTKILDYRPIVRKWLSKEVYDKQKSKYKKRYEDTRGHRFDRRRGVEPGADDTKGYERTL